MRNPIKILIGWLEAKDEQRLESEMNFRTTNDIVVRNDPNDAKNRVYIYVKGIPVMRVCENGWKEDNTIDIKHASEFVGNIKRMYSAQLHKKPIIDIQE